MEGHILGGGPKSGNSEANNGLQQRGEARLKVDERELRRAVALWAAADETAGSPTKGAALLFLRPCTNSASCSNF